MSSAVLALLTAIGLHASPLLREQPDVRAGNERSLMNDPAGALERYAAAERAVGARPELDYDRGISLLRQGRTAEALAALRSAAERGEPPLASKALQNAGAALDAAGDRDGAIRAFADALARDPSNEDARFNLEVLLRRRSEEKKSGGAKDEPDDKPRPKEPTGAAQGRSPADGEAQDRAGEEGRATAGEPTSRQDAERLLDAVRAREQNLPPGAWRRRETRRRDVEEDW